MIFRKMTVQYNTSEMEFAQTILKLKEKLDEKKLPGISAHELMLPKNRPLKIPENLKNPQKLCSVLILLYPKDNSIFSVLTERNTYDGIHSGQISLPGGKQEKFDKDLIETALRESHEEIGIQTELVNVMGTLTPIFIPPSNFWVLPVVGNIKQAPEFKIAVNEVSKLIEYDIKLLLDEKNVKEKMFSGAGYEISAPFFDISGSCVWGATAMILSEFKIILRS
ncbi:MAG: CoA pyrophosphatase [Bacteroidales bacterium]|nr:CoA pyrophosphatase [Bacteroidales bacterium]